MTTYDPPPTYTGRPSPEMTGWVGWSAFAAIMIALAGMFGLIAGFVALFRDEVFFVVRDQMIVSVDYTTWGWVHVIVGLLMLAAAVSLFRGHMYGRMVAVLVASLSALVNLAFLRADPVWATIVIAIDILVIYAVTAHGRELQV